MNKFIIWSRSSKALLPRKAENWSTVNTLLEEFWVVPAFVGIEVNAKNGSGVWSGDRDECSFKEQSHKYGLTVKT